MIKWKKCQVTWSADQKHFKVKMTLDPLEKEKRTFDQLNKVVKSFNQVRKQDFWWTKILSNSNNLFPKSKQANQLNHLNWSLRTFQWVTSRKCFRFFFSKEFPENQKIHKHRSLIFKIADSLSIALWSCCCYSNFRCSIGAKSVAKSRKTYCER